VEVNKLHQVAVYARDLDEAIEFYRDRLGARFLARFDPPGLAFFDFNGTRLLLEQTGPKANIYFRVENIEAAHSDLVNSGVKFLQGPHMIFRDEAGTFGGAGEEEWMAFFKDPSENTLAIAARKIS